MNRKAPRPNQQVLEEASTWFVAFRTGDPGDDARRDFHEWLKRSPEHIRAYLEMAAIYADIPAPEHGLTPPDLIARAKASPELNVVALSTGELSSGIASSARPALLEPVPPRSRARFIGLRAVAAVGLLAVIAVGVWVHAGRNTYATTVGEQRALTLEDGSIVELNARSKVRVAFHDGQRDVELLEGQALFRVAKDHSRPFVVHAGATSVRAVGTQFDVYRRNTRVTVTVLEGRVAVLPSASMAETSAATPATAAAPGGEMLLMAGEQVNVTATSAEKTARPNVAAATAWTQHQLVFDGTPLAEVLEEFSRYTTRRLVIDTPALAQLKISGQYISTNPDSLLRFLSLQTGVVITEVDGETHIRRE